MTKEVNIHVKTTGTPQVKQDVHEVTQDVNRIGESAEQMGSRSSRALGWLATGIKSLAGPLGFAAIIGVVSNLAGKISNFFSELKNRCDESVTKLQNLRKGFEGVFEAMDAFDEKSRKQTTKEITGLLKKTSVSSETGLPVIEQYARQFRGKLSPEQYQQGLEGMLGYAARHGGAATPELITLMGGLGMTSPEQQGVFRRQIGAVSKASGLTDEDIITILGRASPTATAMGWKPEEMLNYIGTIAGGEIGRKKLSMPAATLEALVNPQMANLKDYRISSGQADDPAKLLAVIAARRGRMDEQSFSRMLRDIYGPEAAAGIYKLLEKPGGEMMGAIQGAATPQAAAAEMADELASRNTRERIEAKTQAVKAEILQGQTDDLFYKKQIRDVGEQERENLRLQFPKSQYFREKITPEFMEKEEAAFVRWFKNLSPEEKERILKETKPEYFLGPLPIIGEQTREYYQLRDYFYNLPPEQRYEGLIGPTGAAPQSTRPIGEIPVIINNYYSNDINYVPNIGEPQPRFGREAK